MKLPSAEQATEVPPASGEIVDVQVAPEFVERQTVRAVAGPPKNP